MAAALRHIRKGTSHIGICSLEELRNGLAKMVNAHPIAPAMFYLHHPSGTFLSSKGLQKGSLSLLGLLGKLLNASPCMLSRSLSLGYRTMRHVARKRGDLLVLMAVALSLLRDAKDCGAPCAHVIGRKGASGRLVTARAKPTGGSQTTDVDPKVKHARRSWVTVGDNVRLSRSL